MSETKSTKKPPVSQSRIYKCFAAMKHRCSNPNNPQYHDYGGRGITVCKTWINSFATFAADMGDMPIGMTLDRIDNDLGYSADNCRWSTRYEQSVNRRDNVLLTVDGETLPLTVIARQHGTVPMTVMSRLSRGWCHSCAVKLPPRKGCKTGCPHRT